VKIEKSRVGFSGLRTFDVVKYLFENSGILGHRRYL
jgi:hypothetical protein